MVDVIEKIFYHVVTERPMQLGQILTFDKEHHSGVYERVYNFGDKVNDIYNNPDKYINEEFDHHTKVALRELTLEEAENWYNYFINLGRTTYQIVKVIVNGNSFTGDACNCFDGTLNKQYNLEQAKIYWKAKDNNKGKKSIYETIVDGEIRVIEIIKNNEEDLNKRK